MIRLLEFPTAPRTIAPGRTPGTAPGPGLLHEIFEARADASPAGIAVVHGRARATYADLEQRANRLARHLRGQGVGPGSIVALLLPRSIDAYASMLGILKAGAAYVPIDPGYPADRVRLILADSGARALVTDADRARRQGDFGGVLVRLDADREAITAAGPERLPRGAAGAGPRDLCYVIYTSGSTGRPKGVMIEHRSACHLVRVEGRLFAVRPQDRVYQGFSLSFDASVEEIWLAFQAGATLVAATPEMERSGPDLPRLLTEDGVTVLSCVPTLLSMVQDDIPTLRLLIFGGEACPDPLVERWARRGRRLVNTYGPTEATVIATYADLSPGGPVTIGRALPGYRVLLLNDDLRPVPPGEIGEICIGGVGVARGYIGPPEWTAARFVPDPFLRWHQGDARLYRTGDMGRLDAEGRLRFLGRADGQVKLRGFRIELAEIESALQGDGILAAACALRGDATGMPDLVAYVVPRAGIQVHEERLRARLRERLPSYMVPSLIETLADLPRLPNGKLDRAGLPPPRGRDVPPRIGAAPPRTAAERRIAEVWKAVVPSGPVSVETDFFTDLGGHSLLAARVVSELRKEPRFARVSMTDLYQHPTISSLAAFLDDAASPRHPAGAEEPPAGERGQGDPRERDALRRQEAVRERDAPRGPAASASRARHVRAGLLQAAGLYFVFGSRTLQLAAPYLAYFLLLADGRPVPEAAAWAAAAALGVFPLLLLGAVAAKWILLGRIRPGRHPLWGGYYVRFWFVRGLISALPLEPLCGTPLLPLVFRLFGARIGRDVHLDTDDLAAFDLISIGDGTSVDVTASLLGCAVEEGELVVGPVRVGRRCFVGARSVLREHTRMEDGARLEDQSLLPAGALVPRGETWEGSPARPAGAPHPVPPPAPERGPVRRAATGALYAALVLLLFILPLAAFLPGLAVLTRIDPLSHPLLYLAAAPLAGASFVLLLMAGVVIFKWLLVGRVRAGIHPVHGGFYVRKWIVDQLLGLVLHAAGSIHATLYLPPWYRALGARLGRFVELSTATSITPDLLTIDDGATIADEASLSAARVEGGWMTLAPTRLGRRAFVGNGAVVPPGTALGDGSLVGVVSISPSRPDEAARPGAAWLGSPPIPLPRRQASAPFPEQRTYCPPRRLWLSRGAFEILRVTLPPAGFILVATTVILATLSLWERLGPAPALLLLPLVGAACCGAMAAGVALAKWTLMGRFRPFEVPLWCPYVWRLELVNALYEFMLAPLVLEPLHGTPFLPWYFRLLGARIGRRTYFHTTGLIEFDLVEVGDQAVVNEESVLQTHLFEDRVLKASRLRIGRGCAVGAGSVVLYDATMEDGARLDALSLLMKGEELPAGTAWAGVPASPLAEAHPPGRALLEGAAPEPAGRAGERRARARRRTGRDERLLQPAG